LIGLIFFWCFSGNVISERANLVYEFGPFRLEVKEHRLVHGGRAIPLTDKAFETLHVLVERHGTLVSKRDLMNAVWPEASVEENNLDRNISAVRKALGERAGGRQYIETVPRIGYRFVARLSAKPAKDPSHSPSPTSDISAIAVLPFAAMSPARDRRDYDGAVRPVRSRVRFGRYRFDSSTGQLWAGEREIRLTPKAAGVLAALVARPGELVTKQELFAALWRDIVVSDDSLTSCVKELRKALSDDVKQPRFIETRHRRGYRFIFPVSVAVPNDSPVATEASRQSLGHRAEHEGKPTVAVLPFTNVSGDPGQEYLAEGVAEDLITALSKHRSLLVIARSSTFAFKGQPLDARRIGVDLGADYVVEGSIGRSGQRLRISARLVETEAGRHVWAERYDRHVEEVTALQDEITMAIAGRIEPEVSHMERLRVTRKSRHAFRAWDFFHLGMKYLYNATHEDNEEAQRLFRRAVDLDSGFAEAYAWLSYGIVLNMVYFDADPDDGRLKDAVTLAKKAVELDDQDALNHFAYGRALLACKSYDDALAELESAAELNPSLAVVYCGLGDSLAYEGRMEEAIPYFEKAISLSPFDPQRWAFYSYRALAHLFASQFQSAVEWSHRATRVPHCHYWPFVHRVSALGHLQQGEALQTAKVELLQRKPEVSCGWARRRLFFIKNPGHLELYVEGLRNAGIPL